MSLSEVWGKEAPAFRWVMGVVGALLVAAILTMGGSVIVLHSLSTKVEGMDYRLSRIEQKVWPVGGQAAGP